MAAAEEAAETTEKEKDGTDAAAADASATAAAADGVRVRVGEGRCVGLVVEWRGHMGWIKPLMKIKHEQAAKHQGRVYLNLKDVVEGSEKHPSRVKEGKIVDFLVYADGDGLGAEDCRPRHALRLTLPHREANKLLKQISQWSEFLTDSEYYPTFEREHGVLLRRYSWDLHFAILELWGHFKELATSAVDLAMRGHEEALKLDKEAKEKEASLSSDRAGEKEASAKPSEAAAEGAADAGAEKKECHLRLLLPEADADKAKDTIPGATLSQQATVNWPIVCYSLTIEGSVQEAQEAVNKYLELMAQPKKEDWADVKEDASGGPKGKGKSSWAPKAAGKGGSSWKGSSWKGGGDSKGKSKGDGEGKAAKSAGKGSDAGKAGKGKAAAEPKAKGKGKGKAEAEAPAGKAEAKAKAKAKAKAETTKSKDSAGSAKAKWVVKTAG
eukprot:TRINITY_DN2252_c2_g1_i1.p1 TRINITY_DN2252_c2_g1~~TRINITY_DN2252_c2_g1_i1.p1  ORF type:complete len:440 (+),score=174.84 TRINITY_DN2252_c2_g1_i1:94-1413(+)